MTNPGNLYYYQLCDDHCDEFALLDSGTPECWGTCKKNKFPVGKPQGGPQEYKGATP